MKKYWFARRKYGWGWVPCAWQGWVSLIVFGLVVTGIVVTTDFSNEFSTVSYFVKILGATTLLLIVAFYTGESPRWSWGETQHKNNDKT